MGSVVMGGGLMDLLIRPMKCPGRPCLIGGGYLNRYPTLLDYLGRQLLRHAEAKTWLQQHVY